MDSPSFLTVNEFAKKYRLSEVTIRRRIEDGSLKIAQLGGRQHKILIIDDVIPEPKALPELPPQIRSSYGPVISHSNSVVNSGLDPNQRTKSCADLQRPRSGPRPRWQQHLAS